MYMWYYMYILCMVSSGMTVVNVNNEFVNQCHPLLWVLNFGHLYVCILYITLYYNPMYG